MKLLVCLSLVLGVTTAQEQELNIFDIVAESLKNGTDYLKGMVYESVIDEDGSGYKPFVQSVLDIMEPQLCPSDGVKECVTSDSWLLGCNCRETFAALGECSTIPCRAFSWIKNEAPEALSKFFNAGSYEEKAKVLAEYLVKPMGKLLCECPDVFRASVTCAKNYNGMIFEMSDSELYKTTFENIVKTLDWKAAQEIFDGLLKVSCEQHNGENCMDRFGDLYIKIGTFLDNTFSGQDVCDSMIRAEAEYTAYVESSNNLGDISKKDIDGTNAALLEIMDAYVDFEHEMTCDAECADEIQQIYYNSCCTKRYIERFLEKDMRRNFLKLAKSYARLFFDKRLPNLKPVLKKYFSMYDLENFCGDEVDAYRNFNQQCDAIAA